MKPATISTAAPAVYLCQVSPHVSCGACCGLYNVADASFEALEAMLLRRTAWFAGVPRTVDGIDAFKAKVEHAECRRRPYRHFHHCAFLGMITGNGQRVGCLLHPLADGNHGQDWRGLSYYGGMACRTYFCPSVRNLPERWLTALGQCTDHWYLHGLIVTEQRLLTAIFSQLEQRIGRRLKAVDFFGSADAASQLRQITGLKLAWPFRRRNAPGLCNYFFEDGHHRRPELKPVPGAAVASPFSTIFQELDSAFTSAEALRRAEEIVEDLFQRLAMQLSK